MKRDQVAVLALTFVAGCTAARREFYAGALLTAPGSAAQCLRWDFDLETSQPDGTRNLILAIPDSTRLERRILVTYDPAGRLVRFSDLVPGEGILDVLYWQPGPWINSPPQLRHEFADSTLLRLAAQLEREVRSRCAT